MKKNKTTFWVIGIIIVLGALFAMPRFFSQTDSVSGGNVPCLIEGKPLSQHLHPELRMYVGGTEEPIPDTIGHSLNCEKVIHMHDDTPNVIHVESQDSRVYVLGDFFSVWGTPIEKGGYSLETKVNGLVITDPATLVLKDKDLIEMRYTKLSEQAN